MTTGTLDSASSGADTVATAPPELGKNVRASWSPLSVGAFRMASLYLLFAHALPTASSFVDLSAANHDEWLTSLGSALFGWPNARENIGGCADRANDYLRFGLAAVGAAVAATVWTSLDRGQAQTRQLPYWARSSW
jgi:hypothetical protein